ncbi:MAG: GNAT family N-acetyltransferase [Pseudobdellovibrio sp.]
MLQLIQNVHQDLKLRHLNLYDYKPRLEFEITQGNYILKTATKIDELKNAFRLRYNIFFEESRHKLDVDHYDSICDHLIIVEKKTESVVGTYRMNSSSSFQNFYSQSEFDLKSFVLPYSKFVELGRACISPLHRNGVVISLLWKGIYFYMKQMRADLLFGCSSIKNINPKETALVTKYFEQTNALNTKYPIKPHLSFKIPFYDEYKSLLPKTLSSEEMQHAEKFIPSLLKTYLKVGAEIIGEPAFDIEMNCVDYLTCLKVENLAERYERRLEKIAN